MKRQGGFIPGIPGIRLTPSFNIMTRTTIPIIIAKIIKAATTAFAIDFPKTNCSNNTVISAGTREIILIVRTMEIPFHSVYYVFHHHAAFDDCDSEAGRDAA